MTDAITAANAYKNQLNLMKDSAGSSDDSGSGGDFLQMVKNAAQGAISTQSQAEQQQLQSLTGADKLSDLVTAVSSAELTLNTVVAIRDRVINAYNDIIKMNI